MILQSTLLAYLLNGATEHIARISIKWCYRAHCIATLCIARALYIISKQCILRAPTTLSLRHAERSQGRLLLLLSQSIQAGKKDGEEVVRLGQHPTVSDPK